MTETKTRLCPVCSTPALSAIGVFLCWASHKPEFWDSTTRARIADILGVSMPRVTQMIHEVNANKRKQYVRK